MNTTRETMVSLAALVVCASVSGCFSYRVESNPDFGGKKGLEFVDRTVKYQDKKWDGGFKDVVGADAEGLVFMRVVSSESSYSGNTTRTEYQGQPVKYRWQDVKDVKIGASVAMAFLCFGLLDPTIGSAALIEFDDGSKLRVDSIPFPESLQIRHFLPIWLYKTDWRRAHVFGRACQALVDEAKRGVLSEARDKPCDRALPPER